jgi:hypothetical protein
MFSGRRKAGRESLRQPTQRNRWPDFRAIGLANPCDLFSAHQLLIGFGHAEDSYDDLRRVVLASIVALRLASHDPIGYFARVLRSGLNFAVTDRDHEAAKRMIRRVYDT